jgi:hypothetical protein
MLKSIVLLHCFCLQLFQAVKVLAFQAIFYYKKSICKKRYTSGMRHEHIFARQRAKGRTRGKGQLFGLEAKEVDGFCPSLPFLQSPFVHCSLHAGNKAA